MPTASIQRKYNSIDLCKFLMAIGVVFGHTNPVPASAGNLAWVIYEHTVYLAAPIFFLSSGYFLAAKISSPSDAAHNIGITLKGLYKTAKMYLVWTIVYLPLALFAYWSEKTPVFYNIYDYFSGLVFRGEHFNSWHLWYLLSSVYAYLFVIVLFRLRLDFKKWIIPIGCVCLLSIAVTELTAYSGELPTVFHVARSLLSSTIATGRILYGSIFIPAGFLMARKNLSKHTCLFLFAGCCLGNYFIENSAVSTLLMHVSAIALFGFVLHADLKDHRIYIVLRKLSTNIYLIHMYIWTFYYSLVYKNIHYGWDSFIVTAIISVTVSILQLHLSKKKKAAAV